MLRKIRELDAHARVIVVSADIQTSSQQLVAQAGARGFVNKPFDKAELLKALASVLAEAVR